MDNQIQEVAAAYYASVAEKGKENSNKAFSKLHKMMLPFITSRCRAMLKRKCLIDDGVSQSISKIYNSKNFVFMDDKPFVGYILRVAFNTSLQLLKKEKASRLVIESNLAVGMQNDEEHDGLLDSISFNMSCENGYDSGYEETELHNCPSMQFEKVIEILSSNKHFPDKRNAQIALDGMMSTSVDKKNLVFEETTSNKERLKILEANKIEFNRFAHIAKHHGFDMIGEQLSYDQIVEKYNLATAGAVKTKVHRARQKIKKIMYDEILASKGMDGDMVYGAKETYYKNGVLCGELLEKLPSYNMIHLLDNKTLSCGKKTTDFKINGATGIITLPYPSFVIKKKDAAIGVKINIESFCGVVVDVTDNVVRIDCGLAGLKSSGFYKDGKLDGELIQYYPSRQTLPIGVSISNLKKVSKEYPIGNIKSIRNYVDGKLDGDCRDWYENGNLKLMGSYENGVMVGEWIGKNEDGTIDSIYTYVGDLKTFAEYTYKDGDSKKADIKTGIVDEDEDYYLDDEDMMDCNGNPIRVYGDESHDEMPEFQELDCLENV